MYREPGKRDDSYEVEKLQREAQLAEFMKLCMKVQANYGIMVLVP